MLPFRVSSSKKHPMTSHSKKTGSVNLCTGFLCLITEFFWSEILIHEGFGFHKLIGLYHSKEEYFAITNVTVNAVFIEYWKPEMFMKATMLWILPDPVIHFWLSVFNQNGIDCDIYYCEIFLFWLRRPISFLKTKTFITKLDLTWIQ